MPPAVSAAHKVLRTRALQCSFSSVFHLRNAGMPAPQAKQIENMFVGTVGLPLVVMGAAALLVNKDNA
jgi:hypothetical protein